jgi:hypothetical protein
MFLLPWFHDPGLVWLGGSFVGVPQASTSSRLRPLRWIAEEPLVYDQARNELHRDSCRRAGAGVMELADGEPLELVWAPKVSPACRPDVTMALGAGPVT